MNNVSCKRTYEKAWRSHLHTGLMLKAGIKQLNQRRKAPQICFKENCTFFLIYPKAVTHIKSNLLCLFNKMFCFLQCVLMLEFVRKGLGGNSVWEGVLCRKAQCESQYHTQPCHLQKEHPRLSSEWHLCHNGRWTPEHTNIIWWVLHVGYPL